MDREVKDLEGIGIDILYKLDQHLFRRSTRGASEPCLLKGEFADDVVLMAQSREAAAVALGAYVDVSLCGRAYVDVAREFGMTVSVSKTKFMVVGSEVLEEEKAPISVDGGQIEWVSEKPTPPSRLSTLILNFNTLPAWVYQTIHRQEHKSWNYLTPNFLDCL